MNQKPINTPSKPRVSKIVLCARVTRRFSVVGNKPEYDVQFIADERQRRYEPNARDEAEDFGDERIEAAKDEQSAKDRGTNVTGAEDRGWVAALYDRMTARRGIYGHAQYGSPSEYCLYGQVSERATEKII